MIKIPLPDLKNKLISSGKITPVELEGRIKTKINELSGLISEEGAAYIIANELGVIILPQEEKLKIREIYAGMKNITTSGKVLRKFEVREFNKDNKIGKVCSLVIGDETGTVRLVLWNNQVDSIIDLNEGDTISVKNIYAKENNGNKEIHLGKEGELAITPGENISPIKESNSFERKAINDLNGGEENIELMGTVVQIFDPRFFQDKQGAASYVMNLTLDDGTGTIRTVFWKNQMHHLLGKSEVDIISYKDNLASFEDIKTDLLGEQLKLKGRVKKNDMFNRLEFHVQISEKADPQEEIARMEGK